VKIHRDVEQQSWDWFVLRAGKVTGSELGNLITDKGKIRDWKTAMPNSYLAIKLAEKWRGGPLETFIGNRQTDQGNMTEATARAYFAALLDVDITTCGGIESDDGRLWCSPDGLIGETCGLEIKCPNADTHIGWLLDGRQVPEEHLLQVHFALFVSGWDSWQFLSYCKDLPPLHVAVLPDAQMTDTIHDAVEDFEGRFEDAWKKLCEMNGGPPPPRPAFTTPGPVKFTWEQDQNDVPTP
jgi:hypothetical protein